MNQQNEQLRQQQQQEKVLVLANKFDLLPQAGYGDILEHAVYKINAEIAEATKHKFEPQKQAVLVTRWDAMRELLDSIRGFVDETKSQRDEILNPPTLDEELVNG